jgi:hypothetical protein
MTWRSRRVRGLLGLFGFVGMVWHTAGGRAESYADFSAVLIFQQFAVEVKGDPHAVAVPRLHRQWRSKHVAQGGSPLVARICGPRPWHPYSQT